MKLQVDRVFIPDFKEPVKIACRKVEERLAHKVEEDTREYLPYKSGVFQNRTIVNGNSIYYNGPQAWYLWYGRRMVNAATGKGPRFIPNIGYRWPAGAKLRPTSDPLHYTRTPHAKAGPAWIDRSEKANFNAWTRFGREHIYDIIQTL